MGERIINIENKCSYKCAKCKEMSCKVTAYLRNKIILTTIHCRLFNTNTK